MHNVVIGIAQVFLDLLSLVANDSIYIFGGDKACYQINDIIDDQLLTERFKNLEEGFAILFSGTSSQEDGF